MLFRSALFAGAAFIASAFAIAPAEAATTDCNVAAIQALAPVGTTIVAAAPTAAPVPHCRIDGYVTTTDPGPNQVNFRLQLPDSGWERRYYFVGLGGSAGYVPTDSQIPAGNPMRRGFAVAGTDTGRQGSMLDWSFLSDPAKAADHVHRGAHVTTVAAQQITGAYYGVDSFYRYHTGCSGGGRMGMEAILRYPDDYDGVLLGAPGGRSSATILAFVHAAQQMTREPGAWLSPAKLAMLDRKVTAACDELDGARDNLIWDSTVCRYDFSQLLCVSGDGPECLTAPELRSVRAILAGPPGPNGRAIKGGFPISNISVWSGFLGASPPPWTVDARMENMQRSSAAFVIASTIAQGFYGPDVDVLNLDLTDQATVDTWWQGAQRTQWGVPYSTDLRGLQRSGNKVLFWNGVSDPCCLNTEMTQYYDDAAASVGGMRALRRFAALYSIPGMGHCGGGTGPQDAPDALLDALVNWVEHDRAPAAVVAHRGADRVRLSFADPATGQVSGVVVPPPEGGSRDFLLCRYPMVAVFDRRKADEEGAVLDAGNWRCRNRPAGRT